MEIITVRSAAFDAASVPAASPSSPNRATTTLLPPTGSSPEPAIPVARCSYFFPSGRRCRHSLAPGNSHFCLTHARKAQPPAALDDPILAAELIEAAGEFSTPDDVRRLMLKIFRGMAQRRIPAKDAGILCYIAQTVLHCQRDSVYHQKLQAQAAAAEAEAEQLRNGPDKLTWNLPR